MVGSAPSRLRDGQACGFQRQRVSGAGRTENSALWGSWEHGFSAIGSPLLRTSQW